MFRIDTPHNVVVMPAPAVAGVAGYFQETDPAGTTEVSADWLNAVQEELVNVLLDAGVGLNKTVQNQLSGLIGGAAALKSGAVGFGPDTCWHTRALLASVSSSASAAGPCCAIASTGAVASGLRSTVEASMADAVAGWPEASGARSSILASWGSCKATGNESVIAGCSGTTPNNTVASGMNAAVHGSVNGIAAGPSTTILASQAVECVDTFTVAGGFSGVPVVPTAANQHLTWKDKSTGGHRWGNEFHAGNVNTEVDTIRLNGTTGKAGIDGGIVHPTGAHAVAQRITVNTANINADAAQAWALGNNSIVATSIILWSFQAPDANGDQLAQGRAVPAAGSVTFTIRNTGPAGNYGGGAGTIIFSYIVINPA